MLDWLIPHRHTQTHTRWQNNRQTQDNPSELNRTRILAKEY